MLPRPTCVLALLLASLFATACGTKRPCEGVAGPCVEFTAGRSTEAEIAAAFASAKDGSTLGFGEGTFTFKAPLVAKAKNLTIKGSGQDRTTLDFLAAASADAGLFASGTDGLLLVDFTVQDAAGRGVLVRGATSVTLRRVAATWTDFNPRKHGAYGLSVQESTQVLLDGCAATGATVAGLHVGQSQQVEVRGGTVQSSAAGIELDSTSQADVHDNVVSLNSAGLLVANLSGPQGDARGVRIRNNQVSGNNVARLQGSSSPIALLPTGVGVIIMAGRQVEVSGNLIKGNRTAGLLIVSTYASGQPVSRDFDPYPSRIDVHDDNFVSNGGRPDPASGLGKILAPNLDSLPGGVVPAIVWDGLVDPALPASADPQQLCARGGRGGGFLNLHRDQLDSTASNFAAVVSFDPAPFDCALPPP